MKYQFGKQCKGDNCVSINKVVIFELLPFIQLYVYTLKKIDAREINMKAEK